MTVDSTTPSFASVVTLVLWLMCLVVGTIGFVLPYPKPHPVPKAPVPIQAQLIKVELTDEPLPPLQSEPVRQNPAKPPPLIDPIKMPPAPPLLAVAQPNPAIAFELPVEGPVQIVPAREAAFAKPATPVLEPAPVAPQPKPQTLTFGEGEGKQPAPDYPRRALNAGQEGTIIVRFSVGENGRVMTAEPASPSPWALLNEAALKVVRERWRFRPGPNRLYEVSIRFQLKK